MDLLAAAFLGIVQGITEFLPISSSGHLILARAFSGWDPGQFGLAFDVACHIGTLLAVIAFFWRDIAAMITAAPGAIAFKPGPAEQMARLIVVGTIPVVIVGGLFSDRLDDLRSPWVVATTLAVGAIGLVIAERLGTQTRSSDSIGYGEAFAIGVAQACALVPGVSRAGATLTLALLLGLKRESGARFTFLLSTPAVIAAAAKELLDLREEGFTDLPLTLFAVGLVVSAVVGYLTVKYLIRYLANHSLSIFAIYRFALSAATFAWLLTR